jgi:NitT/TauT family transport system substrate-binding protein
MLLALVSVTGCKPRPATVPSGPPLPVTVGLGLEAVNGLALLAHRQGEFGRQGLAATLSNYPSGKVALGALLRGEVELATVAQTPLVQASFQRSDLRVLAVVGESDNEIKIVARRDRGIAGPADLRGKRLATQSVSSMHFFAHLYLLKQGLTEKDVRLSFVAPEALPDLLLRGEVDAVSMREPLISSVTDRLGANALVLQDRGLYVKSYCLVTTQRYLAEKPATVSRLLQALLEMERQVRRQPEPAQEQLAGALGIAPVVIRRLWVDLDLRVRLPQSLLLSLEDEARWALGAKLVEAAGMPNYLHFVDVNPLAALRAEAVTVIR